MSLPSDIVQLFGTGSVPAIVAGSVLGVFELGEKWASQRAKDALSKWLLTFDVKKAGASPDGTQELFEKIFGERHFSLKCFWRSAAFSVGATIFIATLFILIWSHEFETLKVTFSEPPFWEFLPGWWLISLLWLPWSILVDYVSLLNTRRILHILPRLRYSLITIVVLGIDYCVYTVLFSATFVLLVNIR